MDLINPAMNNGEKKHIVWKDELCASCKAIDECALLKVIYEYTILTYGGIHVASCTEYAPDMSSPYYVDPEEGLTDKVKAINKEVLEQQASLRLEELKKYIEGMKNVISR